MAACGRAVCGAARWQRLLASVGFGASGAPGRCGREDAQRGRARRGGAAARCHCGSDAAAAERPATARLVSSMGRLAGAGLNHSYWRPWYSVATLHVRRQHRRACRVSDQVPPPPCAACTSV